MNVYIYHEGETVKAITKKNVFGIPGTTVTAGVMPDGTDFSTIDVRIYKFIDGALVKDDTLELNVQVSDEGGRLDDLQTMIDRFLTVIHNRIAVQYGYDNIQSVRSWTGFPNPYHKQCTHIADWAGGTYSVIEVITEKVLTNEYQVKTIADIEKFVPPYIPLAQ